MDMIERVARALAKADGKDPDAPAWVQYPGGYPFGTCWRDQYADKARAAIEVMRDHTLVYRDGGAVIHELRGAPDDIWKTLLNAALDQKS